MKQNPFRVGGHVTGPHFTDRAAEVHRIRRALVEPSRLLVYGPRRMGKSSAIAMAADRAQREGCLVAWADFSTATTLTDVSNRLLRSLSAEMKSVPERLLEFAKQVRPQIALRYDEASGLPVLSFDVAVRQAPVEDQRSAFESLLDRVEAFARGREQPVALIFDEFQDILEIGGERADWFLRGVMQRHSHLSYVCAGSRETLIHELLERKRAFFKHFELLHLDPIDAGHLTRWVEDRMRSAGVDPQGLGIALIRQAGPRTQDRLQLAREAFNTALARGRLESVDIENAVDSIIRSEEAVYRAIWEGLSATQQNALRAISSRPEKLYSTDVVSRFGLGSTSTMARAVEALTGRGIVVRAGDHIEFDNPFFRGWVERTLLPDVASG
ncbi:MAG TPA: ATP-binding protein [Longimicrobiales bacterium]|nr:ATP-binding protein [Longimicrobiales bacterium]